jgi:hypothetical protein
MEENETTELVHLLLSSLEDVSFSTRVIIIPKIMPFREQKTMETDLV